VLDIIDNHNLCDRFREFCPDLQRFTRRRKNPIKQAGLNFFLISENLIADVETCNIHPSYR